MYIAYLLSTECSEDSDEWFATTISKMSRVRTMHDKLVRFYSCACLVDKCTCMCAACYIAAYTCMFLDLDETIIVKGERT